MKEFSVDLLKFLENCPFDDLERVKTVLWQEDLLNLQDVEYLMCYPSTRTKHIKKALIGLQSYLTSTSHFHSSESQEKSITFESDRSIQSSDENNNGPEIKRKIFSRHIKRYNIENNLKVKSSDKATNHTRKQIFLMNGSSDSQSSILSSENSFSTSLTPKYPLDSIHQEDQDDWNSSYSQRMVWGDKYLPPLLSLLDIDIYDKKILFEELQSHGESHYELNITSNNPIEIEYVQLFYSIIDMITSDGKRNKYGTPLKPLILLLQSLTNLKSNLKVNNKTFLNLRTDKKRKEVSDKVHGFIEFDRWLFENIIDTHQFQRLRWLSQLGICKFIYPSATHTRFEHSLGVAHLSRKLIENLARKFGYNSEYGEVARLKKCVQIAALCHDIGHGPFSHVFEDFLNNSQASGKWKHEDFSIKITEELLSSKVDTGASEVDEEDIKFVKELISGVPPSWTYCNGLDPFDSFLRASFDIVANRRSGIDVDRIDYIKRDAIYTLASDILPSSSRLLNHSSIVDGEIVFNIQSVHDIWSVYSSRFSLFKNVYAHRKVRAMEVMLCDALTLVDDIFNYSILIEDTDSLINFTDDKIMQDFKNGHCYRNLTLEQQHNLKDARELVEAISYNRNPKKTYRFISELNLSNPNVVRDFKMCTNNEAIARYAPSLSPDDIILDWYTLDYGTHIRDPFDCIKFYSPDNEEVAFTLSEEDRGMYPEKFQQSQLRVYARDYNKFDTIKKAFRDFCKANKFEEPDVRTLFPISYVFNDGHKNSLNGCNKC